MYPYATKVALFGLPLPLKTTRDEISFLQRRLGWRIPGLSTSGMRLNHDLCDALVAAYTAYLHPRDLTESVGLDEGVPIVLSRPSA